MIRLAFGEYGKDFELVDDKVNVLVIENKPLFRKVIHSFYSHTSDELMTFSKNFEPFEFEKSGVFVPDSLNPEPDWKKLLTVIGKKAEALANEQFFELLQKIKECLFSLGDGISERLNYDFSYCEDITAMSLVKLLSFKVNTEELNEAKRILKYLELISEYCKASLFVFAGLSANFNSEELSCLFDSIIMKHYRVLLIEPHPFSFGKNVSVHIIDKDLCCIDSNEMI